MSADKVREEFEAWGRSNHYEVGHKGRDGEYLGGATAIAWEAWKASRESLVVELPHIGDYLDTYQQGENRDAYIADLNAAIHAAGVRTK